MDRSASAKEWNSDYGSSDGDDPAVAMVYGDYDFHSLMQIAAGPADPSGSGHRVERYARYFHGALDDAVISQ